MTWSRTIKHNKLKLAKQSHKLTWSRTSTDKNKMENAKIPHKMEWSRTPTDKYEIENEKTLK